MVTELSLKFIFEASHSLAGYEEPHPHLWRLEFSVTGNPVEGKIIDLVQLREATDQMIAQLSHTFLNDNPHGSPEMRKFPTCETISEFFVHRIDQLLTERFRKDNPSIELVSVIIGICEMDGTETGAVRRARIPGT